MKNLIIALSLFFAVGASAQTKNTKITKPSTATKTSTAIAPKSNTMATTDSKTAMETAAQTNLDKLTGFISVNNETKVALKDLFYSKFSLQQDVANMSAERKNVVKESMEYRLSLLLQPADLEKLKSNKELYDSLVNIN